MRILVLTNLYPPYYMGGYELHCQTLVNALRARGHLVEVLTSDYGVPAGGVDCDGADRSLRIHGLYGYPWLGILRLHELERRNNLALRRAIERIKPDLAYVWSLSGLGKSLLFTLQSLNIPTAAAICDHWVARSPESDVWLRWWNREDAPMRHKLLRRALTAGGVRQRWHQDAPTSHVRHLRFRRLYFCSRALREFTVAAGFDVGHGEVIYCAIDIHRFPGLPRPASHPLRRLLYVGRVTEDKGVMTALRALALVRTKTAVQLSIYGSGDMDYERQLRKFVREKELPVEFAGTCKPEEMPAVYQSHDALLFTSEWPEPFALTPLEAMSSGLPVIGTMTGGSGELFRHGANALTYEAGDPEELARRILQLKQDGALRLRLATNAYNEVRCRFAESVIVDQVETYLLETVELWPPKPPREI